MINLIAYVIFITKIGIIDKNYEDASEYSIPGVEIFTNSIFDCSKSSDQSDVIII